MPMKKSSESRTRAWTFVLYPESAPVGWFDLLDEMHVQFAVSPLHDRDINADGSLKKSHHHVLLYFDGVKSYEQIKEITDALCSPIPQRCHDAKALVRYFCHMDNPNKAQYNPSDIRAGGGFDVAEALRPSSSARYDLIAEMIAFVKDNGIMEFQDLLDYAMIEQRDDWFPLLCDNCAFVVDRYIKSQRHRHAPSMVSG